MDVTDEGPNSTAGQMYNRFMVASFHRVISSGGVNESYGNLQLTYLKWVQQNCQFENIIVGWAVWQNSYDVSKIFVAENRVEIS